MRCPSLCIRWTRRSDSTRHVVGLEDAEQDGVDPCRTEVVRYERDAAGRFVECARVWISELAVGLLQPTPDGRLAAMLVSRYPEDDVTGPLNSAEIGVLDTTRGVVVRGQISSVDRSCKSPHPWRPNRVKLCIDPSGDTVVLLESADLRTRRWCKMDVYVRRDASYVVIRAESLDCLDCVPPRRDALLGPVATPAAFAPTTLVLSARPSVATFSPCGRFLLLTGAGKSLQSAGDPMLRQDALLVLDLSDRTDGLLGKLRWIVSLRHQIPLDVAWSRDGLWLLTRTGVLLLGTCA